MIFYCIFFKNHFSRCDWKIQRERDLLWRREPKDGEGWKKYLSMLCTCMDFLRWIRSLSTASMYYANKNTTVKAIAISSPPNTSYLSLPIPSSYHFLEQLCSSSFLSVFRGVVMATWMPSGPMMFIFSCKFWLWVKAEVTGCCPGKEVGEETPRRV